MTVVNWLFENVFFILFTLVVIYALMAPVNKIPVTEKIGILLIEVMFGIIYLGDILPVVIPLWAAGIFWCGALFLMISESKYGDWIGRFYYKCIKPFKGVYLIIAKGVVLLVIASLFVSPYIVSFLVWKHKIAPVNIVVLFCFIIMLVIGLLSSSSSISGSVWNRLMKNRSENEKQLIAPLLALMFWAICSIWFSYHVKTVWGAIAGLMILLYFTFSIICWREHEAGSAVLIPVCSVMHIASLMGMITLFLYSVRA